MKTDRELLELAAKAAGMDLVAHQKMADDYKFAPWNPLTDDGDALRLAVKLFLKIEHHDEGVVVWHDYLGTGFIPYNGDPQAATRRAIVLAAADAGAMP